MKTDEGGLLALKGKVEDEEPMNQGSPYSLHEGIYEESS